jgi:uncharacterized membrane protein
MALGYTALAGTFCLVRYHLFIATGWDLGFYQQGLWALASHGPSAMSSWGGYPVLARNAAWLLWPLAYPYRVFGVGFLLALQAFAYGVGYYFLFDIGDSLGLSWERLRLLGWIYVLSPLAWGATLFDFHPSLLAVPLILAAYASFLRRRYPAAAAWFGIALATHFLVALVGVAAGVVLIMRRNWEAGLLTCLASGAVLVLDASLVHRLDPHQWLPVVAYWGSHIGHWSHDFMAGVHRVRTWLYLIWVMVPILLFGVRPRAVLWFIPVLAVLVLNISSTNLAPTSPFNQYSVLVIPFIMLACAESLQGTASTLKFQAMRLGVYMAFLLVFFGHEASLRHEILPSGQAVALADAIKDVPPGVPVFTQNFLAPHVANRSDMQLLQPNQTFPAGSYVILDTAHSTGVSSTALVGGDVGLLTHQGHVVYASSGIYVFRVPDRTKGVANS